MPRTVRQRPATVPAFVLYGESGAPGSDLLHVETIASRSQRHRWEIDAHLHQGLYQLLWLRSGQVQASLDGQRQSATGPLLIAIPPGAVHAFRFAPGAQGAVLTLSARSFVEGDAQGAGPALRALFAAPRVWPFDAAEPEGTLDAARLDALFTLLADEFAAPRPAASPVPLWLARVLVWRLAELAALRAPEAAARREHQALFTRFVELVEQHHAAHWPVSRYAERLGLSPERLNRLVRAEAGRSALEFVHERLTREACRRLVYVAAPVSRLAFELGFEDPAYFCRFFKRRIGCSPRDYRLRAGEAPSG